VTQVIIGFFDSSSVVYNRIGQDHLEQNGVEVIHPLFLKKMVRRELGYRIN